MDHMPSQRQLQRLDAWLALTGQLPAPDEPVELPMLSGSMTPAIPVGAVMQILVQSTAKYRVGDVVVFLEGDKLTAHRILLAWQTGPWPWIFEKGDANNQGHWRRPSDIRGRVVSFLTDDQYSGDQNKVDPASPTLASSSLRRALRHWLSTCGGLRAQDNDTNQNLT